MKIEVILLGLILGFICLALVLHKIYLSRIYSRVRETTEGDFKMEDLLAHLELPQGSNFNTIMFASWLLFFVGAAYLFFQTPSIFQDMNYFRKATWIASAWYGMIIFGWGVMALGFSLAFGLTKIYKYYIIHPRVKKMMAFLAPLLLTISILISIYMGSIYPATSEMVWFGGYFALLAPMILLLSPVFLNLKEGVR